MAGLLGILESLLGLLVGFLGTFALGFQSLFLGFLLDQLLLQSLGTFRPGCLQKRLVMLDGLLVLLLQGLGLGIQPVFNLAVLFGLEQGFQNLFPFLGICYQKAAEFPLGQHHQLAELPGLKAQNALNGLGYRIVGLAQDVPFPVRPDFHQRRSCWHRPGAFSPLLGQFLLRGTGDLVHLVLVAEGEQHLRLVVRGGVVAAQGAVVPQVPAGGAVQGKGNGVQNRSLSAAGGTGNQEKAFVPQFRKIDDFLLGVGTKSGHFQLQWAHQAFLPSAASSLSTWCSSSFSWSVRSVPSVSRKKAPNRSSVVSSFRCRVSWASSRGWSRS